MQLLSRRILFISKWKEFIDFIGDKMKNRVSYSKVV